MADACCAPVATPTVTTRIPEPEAKTPWYRDREILLPVFSGVAFVLGLATEWIIGAEVPAQILFWAALILGGITFAPGALRNLIQHLHVGISTLMTISAIGAILLGYIEEAAALAFLYSIAEALEDKAMDRARSSLRGLLSLVPDTARVRRGAGFIEVPAEDLLPGDLLQVRTGERIATDGLIVEGTSTLDTSAITGESMPVETTVGDEVSAGAITTSGSLTIKATAPGTDNSLTTIVTLVEQAQHEKGERARIADRIARPLVPGVIILALIVGVLGSLLGDPSVWITRALVVLVAASPCALALAVPITVVSAIGAASRFGVVFKSGAAFERFGDVRHVAVDKTGTLTRNEPSVVTVRGEGLELAAAVEQHSTHPLARAIVAVAPETPAATDVAETAGSGITGLVEGHRITVGSPTDVDPGAFGGDVTELENRGITAVVVAVDDRPVGVIGVRDELRPEVPAVVAELRRKGIGVTMLTGDNERTARALAAEAGITDVRAGLRPEGKAEAINELKSRGAVAMIGDGINDAPALACADVGVAMGAHGSDAAIESAEIAFTGNDLRLIPQALAHTTRARQIMIQNIVLSLLIIVTLLPLAIFGVLGLAMVVLIHEGAEVVVILNGLRAGLAPRAHQNQGHGQPSASGVQPTPASAIAPAARRL